MNTTVLPPGTSLVEEIARRLRESPAPESDALVVFPGKRPAHFLRRRLAEGRAGGFVPPRILSMDELVDDVFARRDARAGRVRPTLEIIDAVALLYDIQLAAPDPLGGNAFMTLDSFFPVGVKIFNDLEELLIEDVAARKVAEVQPLVEEEVPQRSRERLRTLALFYERLYRAADEGGYSTRSSRYRAVAREMEPDDIPGTGPVILAGFYALTAAERSLFATLAAWPRVALVFQDGPGLRRRIAGLGRGLPEETPPARPATRFYASPDTHGQVFALNASLQEADNRTLIVLPTPDTLFPVLRHCLSRFDPESYNVSLPYPLQRTPLYGFLNSLMELIVSMDGERIYLPAYVTFVLHPYVKNMRLGASAVATRVLFHALEERLAESRTRRFATREEIEGDSDLFDDAAQRIAADGREANAATLRAHLVDIHERTLGAFRSFRDVRDFAERCIALISWVHDQSTARDHPYFTPFSERFVDSLAAIARSLMAGKSFNDTPSYFALLRSYLQARHLSFPGTPLHGLQVLGALETRNLQFERVFILDANEGSLPESGSESTLLPLPVRTALGLSTYRDQEDIAAYHFELLAAGAKELHLFSVTGGEKERSRFVERLLWERQKALGALDEQRLVRSIHYKVSLSAAPPPSVEKTPALIDWLKTREYSATALDTYLQCPLKFYYKNVLGLGPRDEPGGEIEAVDIGIFVHNVLFHYFTPRLGRPLLLSDADPQEMAALVDRMFVERFGSADAGAFRLMRDQVRRHLRDFVDTYLRQLTTDHRFTMQALEHGISGSWHGFALRGRLDAVADRDGVSCLVDYKSGARRASYAPRLSKLNVEDRDSWSAALPSLQLPFYVLLRSTETGQDPADLTAMVLLLGRNQMDRNIEVPLFVDPAEARAAWPRVSAVIAGLLDEIVNPEVPFASSRELKSRCTRCDFSGICGTSSLSMG